MCARKVAVARFRSARYRSTSFCFNDDIQSTAAVTLAGFLGYARSTGVELSGLRIVCAGGGSSALGILDLAAAYVARECGLTEEEARRNFFVLDSKGLIGSGRSGLNAEKQKCAGEHWGRCADCV